MMSLSAVEMVMDDIYVILKAFSYTPERENYRSYLSIVLSFSFLVSSSFVFFCVFHPVVKSAALAQGANQKKKGNA